MSFTVLLQLHLAEHRYHSIVRTLSGYIVPLEVKRCMIHTLCEVTATPFHLRWVDICQTQLPISLLQDHQFGAKYTQELQPAREKIHHPQLFTASRITPVIRHGPTLAGCRASVCDAGPTSSQRRCADTQETVCSLEKGVDPFYARPSRSLSS